MFSLNNIGHIKMPRTSEDAFQNSQKYSVCDNSGFVEAAASFIYRGHLISFSTIGYNKPIQQHHVLVTGNNGNSDIVKEFDTVESAIVNINNWLINYNPS